jgi:hypothetical protein
MQSTPLCADQICRDQFTDREPCHETGRLTSHVSLAVTYATAVLSEEVVQHPDSTEEFSRGQRRIKMNAILSDITRQYNLALNTDRGAAFWRHPSVNIGFQAVCERPSLRHRTAPSPQQCQNDGYQEQN